MQGFNMGRYVPPDLEGTTSANRLAKKRAPGALRKDGTQTVRFEMPFAVWCHTCKPHAIIGQGVRFNAEKKKIGYYYSTPIWQFKLKHVACGGFLEIKTDPKETAYVVVAGGKARDYGEDRVREGEDGRPILTPLEREKRREDAFAVLEGKAEEKEAVKDNAKRIEELYRSRERDWEDPGNVNKKLRQSFRRERKLMKREEDATESLKERIGTDIDILPETELDAQRAKLVSFDRGLEAPNSSRDSSPFFRTSAHSSSRTSSPRVKAASNQKSESKKNLLRRQLVSSTRAAMNPFG
jgi:coiled-coil domain-containing protein 130